MALIAATVARPADKDMAFDGCLVVGEVLVQAGLVYCCKPGSHFFPFHADVVNAAANPNAGLWSAARAGTGLGDPRFQSVSGCVEITKSFLGDDDVAMLAPSSGEEPTSPRHRASVASMAWRSTRRLRTNAPKFDFHTGLGR